MLQLQTVLFKMFLQKELKGHSPGETCDMMGLIGAIVIPGFIDAFLPHTQPSCYGRETDGAWMRKQAANRSN